MLDKLDWQTDRVLIDEWVFRLEHSASGNLASGTDYFRFSKTKELVDQYARYWATLQGFAPNNVFELGIWDGGSVVLWFEHLHPKKHVALDLKTDGDSKYFQGYLKSKGVGSRIKTYWGTNQADEEALRRIVADEFVGPIDLVIDDASHLYGPTKASFQFLFPLLRPGGIYIIEDWAWAHWKGIQIGHAKDELTPLIFELVEAAGSSTTLIADVSVFQSFVALYAVRWRFKSRLRYRSISIDIQNPLDQAIIKQAPRASRRLLQTRSRASAGRAALRW